MNTTETIRFNLDGVHNRTLRDWNYAKSGVTPQTNARNHAFEHGAAGAWRADDSFVLYYRENGRVRQTTWKQGKPI